MKRDSVVLLRYCLYMQDFRVRIFWKDSVFLEILTKVQVMLLKQFWLGHKTKASFKILFLHLAEKQDM